MLDDATPKFEILKDAVKVVVELSNGAGLAVRVAVAVVLLLVVVLMRG